MKIVLITKYFFPDNSVDSTSSLELIIALLNRNPSLDIHIVTTNSNYKNAINTNRDFSSDYKVHQIKTLYNGNNKSISFISGLIDGLKMVLKARSLNIKSIISLTNPPLISLWCALLLNRKQWFYWTFDLFPDALPASGIISKTNFLYRLIHYLVYKNHPSVLITLGKNQYKYLKNTYKENIENIILPCGVLNPDFHLSNSLPDWYHSHNKYIGYIGNLGRAHSKDFIQAVIENLNFLEDYILILALYGSNKKEIEDFVITNKVKNIIIVDKVEKQYLTLIDIHLVSLLDEWTHISVPSKAVSAVSSGCVLIFYGNSDSDTWSLFRDCSFLIEDLKNIPELFKSISPSIINTKRNIAQMIAKNLLDQQQKAYDKLIELLH